MKPAYTFALLGALALSGCKNDDDDTDVPVETDTDTDTDTDADADTDTDADADTDSDTDTDPAVPGEGSLTLQQVRGAFYFPTQELVLWGFFADSLQGFSNFAECYPAGRNFCMDQFPAVEDDYVEHFTNPDLSILTFQDVGPTLDLGPYNAALQQDPQVGIWYQEVVLPPYAPGSMYTVNIGGGDWGFFAAPDVIEAPDAMDVIVPDVDDEVWVLDGQTVDFEWTPGTGLVTLGVVSGFQGENGATSNARTYLLEDDGQFSLNVDDLGLVDTNQQLIFILSRVQYEDVDVNGNPLHIGVRDEAWMLGLHPPLAGKTEISATDACDPTADVLTEGEWFVDLRGFVQDVDPTVNGCTSRQAFGPDGFLRVTVPDGQRLSIDAEMFADDVSIYLVEDCTDVENTCVSGSDYGFGTEESIRYTNSTGADQDLYLVLDASNALADSYVTLDVSFDNPPATSDDVYDSCVLARNNHVLAPGVHTIDLRNATDDLDPGPFGCSLQESPGPDVMAAVDVPAGQVVRVTADAPVPMYMLTDCADESTCVAGAPAYEAVEFENLTGTDQIGFIVFDDPGDPGTQGPFEITVSAVEITQIVAAEDCTTVAAAPTFGTGVHILFGNMTGYPNSLDLMVPGPSCTGFPSDGNDGIINIHLEDGETVDAAYEQTGLNGDGVLYLLETCTDTTSTLACDDGIPPIAEELSYTNTTGGPQDLFMVLDNYSPFAPGTTYTLRLEIQ